MEFRDLKKQYEVLKSDIDKAMITIARESHYIMGQVVKDLEQELAEYVGVKYCKTCANGTDALTLALKAMNVKKNDAVFVPDFTFFASAEVVALEGATPVFVDVDKYTFNIDCNSLEKAITTVLAEGKVIPKVVIAVDLFGLPANFSEVRKVADKYHLFIVEDGAQGFGGKIGEKKSCSFGDISTTSFFPAKPLGCYGDGGAVFTDNEQWADLIESYRVHGKGTFKYDNVRIGINSRLDTIQAAILQVKFKAFKDYELIDVNKAATLYTQLLRGKVKTPIIPQDFYSSWAQYTITLTSQEERYRLQQKLKAKGIPSMVYYPTPMSKQTAFKDLKQYVATPNSEQLSQCVLSLPMHPYITEQEINSVVNC